MYALFNITVSVHNELIVQYLLNYNDVSGNAGHFSQAYGAIMSANDLQ